MTPQQFDSFLVEKRAELLTAFKTVEPKDIDIYTKLILDHQEQIAKALFNSFSNTQALVLNAKSDIIKDNQQRFELMMKELKEINTKVTDI